LWRIMEEDLELRALKLKKLMRLTALKAGKAAQTKREELTFDEALRIVKQNLINRGDEVLEAALEQYPEQARRIIMILAKKILGGELTRRISGEMLMSLFDYLGIPVKLKTRILYYKKGEYKSIADLIKE